MTLRFMLVTNVVRAFLEQISSEWHPWGLDLFEVLPTEVFVREPAESDGRLRAALETNGAPLAAMDVLIAAHALAIQVALVSNDNALQAFPGLELVKW